MQSLMSAALIVAMPTLALAIPQYTITPITPAGYQYSYGTDINNNGDIVGYYVDADGNDKAYIYTGGSVTTLNQTAGFTNSSGLAINDFRQIAGYQRLDGISPTIATRWSPSGNATLIGSLGSDGASLANGISNTGVVVGQSQYSLGAAYHGFTHTTAGGVVDYGTLNPANPDAEAVFYDVNSNGKIVGNAWIGFSADVAISASTSQVALSTITSTSDAASYFTGSINAAGVAFGTGNGQPVFFNADNSLTYLDMSSLGLVSQTNFSGSGLNDHGDAVGRAWGRDANGVYKMRTYAYVDGQIFFLEDAVAGAQDWIITATTDINNNGQITGTGIFNGLTTAYILTPVPEPASVALIALTSTLLLRRRR